MRYLLDTNIFIWSLDQFEKLNETAQGILSQKRDELYLSAASSWEISLKAGIGKLRLPDPPEQYVPSRMSMQAIQGLQITHAHALAVSDLPRHHKDPFDRLLIAQARMESLVLMTADSAFKKYPIEILWCGR